MLLFSVNSFASDAKLTWHANNEADLLQYKIYYGNKTGQYNTIVSTGNVTEFEIKGLDSNLQYFFVLTAIDSAFNESIPSAEVSLNFLDTKPDPPTGLKVIESKTIIININ